VDLTVGKGVRLAKTGRGAWFVSSAIREMDAGCQINQDGGKDFLASLKFGIRIRRDLALLLLTFPNRQKP